MAHSNVVVPRGRASRQSAPRAPNAPRARRHRRARGARGVQADAARDGSRGRRADRGGPAPRPVPRRAFAWPGCGRGRRDLLNQPRLGSCACASLCLAAPARARLARGRSRLHCRGSGRRGHTAAAVDSSTADTANGPASPGSAERFRAAAARALRRRCGSSLHRHRASSSAASGSVEANRSAGSQQVEQLRQRETGRGPRDRRRQPVHVGRRMHEVDMIGPGRKATAADSAASALNGLHARRPGRGRMSC